MWEWIEKAKKFLNKITDKFLGKTATVALRDRTQDYGEGRAKGLTDDLVNDRITIADWERSMRQMIKEGYIQQYLLGRGGQGMLTQFDYGSIGGMIRDQYRYLDGFVDEIAAGTLSPGQIAMRARMYLHSTGEAFERAHGRAYDIPEGKLPAYPKDGQTVCLTSCNCTWDIEEVFESDEFTGWECRWVLLPISASCPDCIENSITWAPLHIEAG